ncbi:hypothetical protein EJ06DRAFT_270630 [Trichodelitschia bisporula]|uniref:Uncharacterized protein n=1 Tax=Trichodelitschia bisporula TaxID=703511 RepID=A0A6G1HI27_9PEZI|nr:hypothetical protein EJ06DRAFT_270630 [Trichodelitschia bisporula]
MIPPDLKQEYLDLYDLYCDTLLAMERAVYEGQQPYDFELVTEEICTALSRFVTELNYRKGTATEKFCDRDFMTAECTGSRIKRSGRCLPTFQKSGA